VTFPRHDPRTAVSDWNTNTSMVGMKK